MAKRSFLGFLRGNAAEKVSEEDRHFRDDPTVVTRLYEGLKEAMDEAEDEMEKAAEKAEKAGSAFKKPDSYTNVVRHLSNPPKPAKP